MRQARPWTKGEDSLLRDAVSRQEGEPTINWHEVASFIEGRNNKECRKRWVYALEPSIQKGFWEPAEDERLRKGVQDHGTKWAEVARVVGTRHPDQCSKRWHEVLKPNINRDRWSLMEDTTLRNAVLAHGRKWIEIVERYFPERTPIGTRNRYFQLQKKDTGPSDPNAIPNSEGAEGPERGSSEDLSWTQQGSQFSPEEFTGAPPSEFFGSTTGNYPNIPISMAPVSASIEMAFHPQMAATPSSAIQAPGMPAYYPPQYMATNQMPGFENEMDPSHFAFQHAGHR